MVQILTLPDGRKLDYTVTEGSGTPLLWLHGTPGSVLAQPGIAAACKAKDIPLINCSRAGYGNSTRNKGRKVVDAVADLRALLDHLGFEKCYVGGWSGGGPHALACAARLRGCIAVVTVGAVAPYEAEGLDWFAGQGEDNVIESQKALEGEAALAEYYIPEREQMLKATPEGLTELMASILPPIDKETMLQDKEMGSFMVDTIAEGFKNNADGCVDDSLAFVEPWGFDISEAKCPVFLYHGSEDKMCPYAHGKWIAARLSENVGGKKHLFEGQGHISIFIGKEADIVEELLSVK